MSKKDVIVRFSHVDKIFHLDKKGRKFFQKKTKFYALRDISFEIESLAEQICSATVSFIRFTP